MRRGLQAATPEWCSHHAICVCASAGCVKACASGCRREHRLASRNSRWLAEVTECLWVHV
eukprot:7728705-Alexandrium_andersonii.AAC.1